MIAETRPIMLGEDHFVEALIGYRAFRMRALNGIVHLYSISSSVAWPQRRDMRADCPWRSIVKHEPPGAMCSCGLWAYYQLEDAQRVFAGEDVVLAEIAAYGDVVMSSVGFRAELARITAIHQRGEGSVPTLVTLVAQGYDVPIVTTNPSLSGKKATDS